MIGTVRDATIADLDAIMALERATFPADAWSPTTMAQELAGPHSRYILVEEDGRVVAYAGLRLVPGDEQADIQTIAVAEPARRRGIARRLIEELSADAARRGARELLLEVRADNEPARALYAAFGFVEIGVRAHYYQPDDVDAIVMKRELP